MMSLLPFPENRDMVWDYLPELNRPLFHFYYFLLSLAAAGLIMVCQYRIPVSIPVSGTVRPATERAVVNPAVAGTIERMFVKEGDTVKKNDLLFVLKDAAGAADALANETELSRQQDLVQDLRILTATDTLSLKLIRQLKTPLYREQAAVFLSKEAGEKLNWTGARHDADLGRLLVKDKVISAKEFFDQELNESKMRMAGDALHRMQWAAWQAELLGHRQTLDDCLKRKTQLTARAGQTEVRSPLAGVLSGLRGWYEGCSIRPDQTVCTVSPEGELIGECYVSARNAGLLHPGQLMRIRIDAFNTGQFGVLPGKILSVSDDISVIGDQQAFIVRCAFERNGGSEFTGYHGQIKKGLGFQARCLVAERTLFQLLYDRMEDWFSAGSSSAHSA